jgi:hypothetical protein
LLNLQRNLASYKYRDCLCFAGIFLVSLLCGWLLSLAYPDGMATYETSGYWSIARDFHWLSPNKYDWIRTIPFGAVLTLSSNFSNPSNAIYWLNTAIFSLNGALVFVLGRLLFGSPRWALALALCALWFEVVSMRLFFFGLQMTADPLMAELIYLGVLLALIGWLGQQRLVFICAYAIFGLAAFLKPAAVSLFTVWIPFAILSWSAWTGELRTRLAVVCASVLITIAPLALWSLRNLYLYGALRSTGFVGYQLLQAALPTMSDRDQIFDDPRVNAAFLKAVRECEQLNNLSLDPSADARVRQRTYESFYIWGTGPGEFFAHRTDPHWQPPIERLGPGKLFALDADAGRAACRIIASHPADYLGRVMREYVDSFSPLALPVFAYETYQVDPVIAYNTSAALANSTDFLLYRAVGRPVAMHCNLTVAQFLGAIHNNSIFAWFLDCYYVTQLVLCHLIFIAAVICYGYSTIPGSRFYNVDSIRKIAIVEIMLFLTVASHYAVISLVQIAQVRYSIGCDIELHLLVLVAFFAGIKGLARLMRRSDPVGSLNPE